MELEKYTNEVIQSADFEFSAVALHYAIIGRLYYKKGDYSKALHSFYKTVMIAQQRSATEP